MNMLGWAIVAFVVCAFTGMLGFTGLARGVATPARWLFGIFLAIALVLIVLIVSGVRPVP